MKILDSKIRRYPGAYIAQCALASVVLMVLFVVEDVLAYPAVLAAIGSTTFIVFAMPSNPSATPRRIIGGHFVGVVVGSACAFFLASSLGVSLQAEVAHAEDVLAALSVGIAIFAMVLTDTEHAPAAGTALGLVLVEWDFRVVGFVLIAAVALSLAHRVLRSRLKDLT
ncbi:MAG: HPP family protein [Chloroflexota bacterium]